MKLLMMLFLVALTACAHKHKEPNHHHEHKPASLIGFEHDTYKFDHGGQTYHFDTEDQKNKFVDNLKQDLKNSNCLRKGRSRVCKE